MPSTRFFVFAIALSHSGGNVLAINDDTTATAGATETKPKSEEGAPSGFWEKLVMHPFYDAEGTVVVKLPLPSAWQVMRNPQPGEPTIVGPNGIKTIDFPGQNFVYTSDPQLQQSYLRGGQRLSPMPGIETLIQQDLAPWCAGQGLDQNMNEENWKKLEVVK
jgi:hypothetical protein